MAITKTGYLFCLRVIKVRVALHLTVPPGSIGGVFDAAPPKSAVIVLDFFEIGSFVITLEMPGAPAPITDKGKYMTVYVRGDDGKLRIKAETWNTDMNPMEMMGDG